MAIYILFRRENKNMNKIIKKEYKRLVKIKSLDKLDIHFLLKRMDDKFTLDDYLKLIK